EASTDVLVTEAGVQLLEAPRIGIEKPQGTGCTLSSAIAARLSRGDALADAIQGAKAYVSAALERAAEVRIGHGARPLIHAAPG
ncbi:MAG: bifunctional hydroxymethylpyrimidine kinase/phosphomethylpyrimidine kinase, partial [Planctomycetota bacterium]